MNNSERASSSPARATEPASPGRKRRAPLGGSKVQEVAGAGAQFSAGPPQGKLAPLGGSEVHEVTSVGARSPWPYPRWIAHRGAGKLAPENTLAAFRAGASHGYRMFECDVKLSSDGVPFLLHDATLERTTSGHGVAGDQPWHALSHLDAGSWHSRAFAGEALPTLAALARFCLRNGYHLNIEIKPTPGTDQHTGEAVARLAQQLWQGAAKPLLTSFSVPALQAAQTSAPELPRGLLLYELPADWLQTALALGCIAVVSHHELWNASTMAQARSAGLRTLAYTVNAEQTAQHLIELGCDGIITDRVDLFCPSR